MLTCFQLEQSTTIQQLSDDYLPTLTAPMDGMWASAIIPEASFWEIQANGQQAGYFCLDTERCLLRFHLWENYLDRARDIFHWLLSTHSIQQALASTIEPLYFSLCLDFQKHMTPHTYLFQDHHPDVSVPNLTIESTFRKATSSDLPEVVNFYQANIEGAGEWIPDFLHRRIEQEELFLLYDQQTLAATGECIPSQKQIPYADLGMVVARTYRSKGLGSFMLTQLKKYCYETGLKPICSCEVTNLASRKAIEKAGFVSLQRIMQIEFSTENFSA
jgi:GNAT superfamily N-acetyltransferase